MTSWRPSKWISLAHVARARRSRGKTDQDFDVVTRFVATELITRLTDAFSIALTKAIEVHAKGRDRGAVTEVLATAEEIIRAIEVLRDIHTPNANEIVDGVGVVDSMRASLEAATIRITAVPSH